MVTDISFATVSHRREVRKSTSTLTSSPLIMSAADVDETSGRNSIGPRFISPDNFHISVYKNGTRCLPPCKMIGAPFHKLLRMGTSMPETSWAPSCLFYLLELNRSFVEKAWCYFPLQTHLSSKTNF